MWKQDMTIFIQNQNNQKRRKNKQTKKYMLFFLIMDNV